MKASTCSVEEGSAGPPVLGDSPASRRGGNWAVGAAAIAGCLVATAVHMSPEWTLNETYHYGWVVPALAAYLVSIRWRDRPRAASTVAERLPLWGLAAAAVPVIWIVREANPDWRLVGVALACLTVGVALLWLGGAGGRVWVRHFAGSFGFLLLAAPWPAPFETPFTQLLMEANAGLALEALHWLGVPASRSGSLITVQGATLGVEEACSGIRSLQATVMMACFLGEMLSLRWRSRGLLLALGVGTALLTNVARTVWLSTLAAGVSPAAADRWHDAAGLIVLAVHAAVLITVAHRFACTSVHAPVGCRSEGNPSWPWIGPFLVLTSLVLSVPLTAWWYGRHDVPAPPTWLLLSPEAAPDYAEAPIPSRTRQILRYHAGWSARWRTPAGHQLHAFFLTWRAADAPPEILHSHEPGNCLAVLGMKLVHTYPDPLRIDVPSGGTIWARCLEFSDRGKPLYVFHAIEESLSGSQDVVPAEELTRRGRLRYAWLGRRSESLRLIEIGIWNAASDEEARTVAVDFLRDHLRPVGGD